MGHSAHLWNQFTRHICATLWLYHKRKKPIISFLRNDWSLFVKPCVHMDTFCQFSWNWLIDWLYRVLRRIAIFQTTVWPSGSGRNDIYTWLLHFHHYRPFKKCMALSQFRLKLAQWFWCRRFLNFVCVLSLFRKNLP